MIRVAVVLVVLAVIAGLVGVADEASVPAPVGPEPTPAPPALSASILDHQDRTDPAHRRRESRVFDDRPLLRALPLQRAGLRIDLAGLGRDGRTVVLRVSPGTRSHATALAIYDDVLAEHADSGRGYRPRWER